MKKLIPLFLAVFFTGPIVFTETSSGQIFLMTPEELSQQGGPLLILDARTPTSFREGRIPGSQHVNWKNWAQEDADVFGLWFGKAARAGLSKTPDENLQNKLRKLGLSNAKPVLVVGEDGGWGEEGRIAWNLLYWGVDHVILLNGGYAAWAAIAGNKPEIGRVQKPATGDFVFRLRPERRASVEEVQKALADKSSLLIDNRSAEEYNGQSIVGQKRGGRIPGAISVPVEKLYQPDGFFIGKTRLTELFENSVSSAPIAYCAGGVRSALFALLWESYVGELVANYEGSFWEWSAREELPVE